MDELYNSTNLFKTTSQTKPAAEEGKGGEAGAGAAEEGKGGEAGAGAAEEGKGGEAGAGAAEEGKGGEAGAGAAEEGKGGEAGAGAAEEGKGKIDDVARKEIEDAALKTVLDKLGVKSLEELQKKPAPDETEEVKKERLEKEKASVIDFAVKHKILSLDQITGYEGIKNNSPEDLAKADFAKAYKEANKDRLNDEKELYPVTQAEIDDEFRAAFHLDSDNPGLKVLGEKLLAQHAQTLLGDTGSKLEQVTEQYREFKERDSFYPTFKGFVKDLVKEIPEFLEFKKGDEVIQLATDKIDKAALEKMFATNNVIYDGFYKEKGGEKIRQTIKDQLRKELISQNIDAIVSLATDHGEGIGLKKGSKVGAEAPFVKPDGQQQQQGGQKDAADVKKKYADDQKKHYA